MKESETKFVETNESVETPVTATEINTQDAKISKITKVSDEIAFQTNILALNAAVAEELTGQSEALKSIVQLLTEIVRT